MDAMPWEDLYRIPVKKSIMASSPWLVHRFTYTQRERERERDRNCKVRDYRNKNCHWHQSGLGLGKVSSLDSMQNDSTSFLGLHAYDSIKSAILLVPT